MKSVLLGAASEMALGGSPRQFLPRPVNLLAVIFPVAPTLHQSHHTRPLA